MIDEAWFETTGKMLLSDFCLAFDRRKWEAIVKTTPERLAVLQELDSLEQNHCKTCTEISGKWGKSGTIATGICRTTCPIGQRMRELGNKLGRKDESNMRVKSNAVESVSSGSGPVVTTKMSPEELEDYRARTGYREPRNRPDETNQQPVPETSERKAGEQFSSEEQSQRAKLRGRPAAAEPDKMEVLRRIAKAESIASIERSMGLPVSKLHYYIKKWGLTGITAPKARELLAEIGKVDKPKPVNEQTAADRPLESDSAPDLSADEEAAARIIAAEAELHRENDVEVESLKAANVQAVALAGQAAEKYESKIEQMRQEIDRLTADNTVQKSKIADQKREIDSLTEDLEAVQWQADERLKYLKETFGSDLKVYPFPTITLTYALIDFGVDTEDQRLKVLEEANEYLTEIEAAGIDLTRTSSELYDAGQSFVGLIRKQLQELCIEDVDGAVRRYFEQHNRRHLEKMAGKLEKVIQS